MLQLHNRYQLAGGEDVVVHAERELLSSYGHEVDILEANNADIVGLAAAVKAAADAIYSIRAKETVAARIARFRPDIVHVHNFFPLLSPSIYYACREASIPVVQTLHNYRLICPNARLLRQGLVCEDCVGRKLAWPGVLHACYRDSHAGSAAVAAMVSSHRWLGTWHDRVDCFIALTEFSKKKLVEGGLPEDKIVVKPNFGPDPSAEGGICGGCALFVGRLSAEKGIETLLSAWEYPKNPVPLKVAGDGPLREKMARAATEGRIEYLGMRSRAEILELMRGAAFLVFPSVWYECFPLVIVEAFACGLPVIASQMGAMEEVIEHGRTGLHFRPGDVEDLAAKVEWAVTHPKEMARMRHEARAEYLAKYTPERNYELLMQIYRRVTSGKEQQKTGSIQANS